MSENTTATSGGLSSLALLHADSWSEPFWAAAREHRLVCQRCGECGTYRMPPAAFCYRCRSQKTDWVDLPGTGTVYSYTSVNYATAAEITPADLPYVVVVVELDGCDGCKLVGNLLGVAPEDVTIGARVQVEWDDAPTGVTVPRFVPEAGTAG
jgi:uncharacterized OB-fold protein